MTKPVKEAVAFYAMNPQGSFLCVKRADSDESLPGLWGLPAASLREAETPEMAVVRAAHDKLGIDAVITRYVGDDTQERDTYTLHLREYEIDFPKTPVSPQSVDSTVSNYAAFQWSNDPEVLREAADKGSSCSRIFLRNLNLWPKDS